MDEDERCCGTGTCLINADGLCWCGQQWDGASLCRPAAPERSVPPEGKAVGDGMQGDAP